MFFGPDSLRFAAFIRAHIPKLPPQALIVDIGAGSGVGGLFAGALAPNAHVAMTDVNPMALRLARINAAFCGVSATLIAGEGLTGVTGSPALILANPPYIAGDGPTYSQGNGRFGEAMSLQWTREALARLASGGRLLLYTGSAIVRGRDRLKDALAALCDDADCDFSYRELDPDVFPGVLLKPRYWPVERIAAVGAVMVKRV